MKFVVKNTTRCGVLDLLCPHSCRGCGRLGSVLCERCKKNLITARRMICPVCKQEFELGLNDMENMSCSECDLGGFTAIFAAGWRDGVLKKMVEEYKYQAIWALGDVLAEVLEEMLPSKDEIFWRDLGQCEVVIVPLPTIGRHVRERGLDHTFRMAHKLAKWRGWKCERILSRAADTVQVGAKAADREEQARKAYEVYGKVDAERIYVLLDDVWTTGASMRAAAEVMRLAGAKRLIGLVVAVGKAREI